MLTFAGVVDDGCDAEAKQSRAEQAKQSKKEDVTCNGALLCFALLCFAFALRCFAFALLCFAFAYSRRGYILGRFRGPEDTSSGDFGHEFNYCHQPPWHRIS